MSPVTGGAAEPGAAPALDPASFHRLRETVYRRCGIYLAERERERLAARLLPRLAAQGEGDLEAFVRRLDQADPQAPELHTLFEAAAVSESRFFRHPALFGALLSTVLPERRRAAVREGRPAVDLLSAGCATGEEPYTVALLLADDRRRPPVSIVGCDLSVQALQAARAGCFFTPSLRHVPAELLRRHFEPMGSARRLRPSLARRVRFQAANLQQPETLAPLGDFDVILCRNVLIHFDAESRRRTVAHLRERLRPGGWLLLGSSESLHGLDHGLRLVHFSGALGYRRR